MSKNTSSSGLGLASVLTIIFVVLKLVGVIDWSWWWVFSPILIDIGFSILILVIVYVVYSICENKGYRNTSKKGKNDKWKF
jgi:hypothetical protein